MSNPKFDKLLAVFCWFGSLCVGVLEAHMFRMLRSFPELADILHRNMLLIGLLLAVWLAAAVWFTIQVKKSGKNGKNDN